MKTCIQYIFALAALLMAAPAAAQSADQMILTPEEEASVLTLQELTHRGDSVYLKMVVNPAAVEVKTNQTLNLIPVLTDSLYEITFPAVEIKGRQSYKLYKRKMALMSRIERERYLSNVPYAVIRGYEPEDLSPIHYDVTIPFEPWMLSSFLQIRNDDCGCAGKVQGRRQTLLATMQNEKAAFAPQLAFITPAVEAVKNREISAECHLRFKTNQVDILTDYMDNPSELAKIRAMIDELKEDGDISIRRMSIEGYASPEGSYERNKWLSEHRALALKEYLAARYDLPADQYTVSFGGENWKGLRSAVQKQDLTFKDKVMQILDAEMADDSKKTALKSVDGVKTYKQMLTDLYPSLRIAICHVDYSVKQYTSLEEAKRVYATNRRNLSLDEMYRIANSYPKGSDDFNDVFETAARMYPNDAVANVNAAASALMRGDTKGAETYLQKVRTKVRMPEYDNAMGVLHALNGHTAQAVSCFKAAAATGLEAATLNLRQMNENE